MMHAGGYNSFLSGRETASRLRRWLAAGLILALVGSSAGPAYALPENPQLRHGTATFDWSVTDQLTISQSDAKVIIDWDSFSIDSGETVRFNQSSPGMVALNRVTGLGADYASRILGRLEAGAQVFLVNPNGIVFGPGAQVDVGALLASTPTTTS